MRPDGPGLVADWDHRISERQCQVGPKSRSFWRFLTFAGYAETWALIYAALLFWPGGGLRFLGVQLVAAETVGLAFLIPLRYLVRRERPVPRKPGFLPIPWERYSFPSSHALRSSAVAIVLTLSVGPLRWVAIPLALLVGWSRVVLRRHFPTDVIAGVVLGAACGGGGAILARALFETGAP